MDAPDDDPGDSAGSATDGGARWRTLCDVRFERPLSPHYQPQQPFAKTPLDQCARGYHSQREAHVAGSGRCALRQQRATRTGIDGSVNRTAPTAPIACRCAQGKAGAIPSEPFGEARRLLRSISYCCWSAVEAPSGRIAEKDGAGALQALYHPQDD